MIDIERTSRLLVVGSINRDLFLHVEHMPAPGETLLAADIVERSGGKGANQAVAAARLQCRVSLLGCLGDDAGGAALLRELRHEGVEVANIEMVAGASTGLAVVCVLPSGENFITVVQGANRAVEARRVRSTVSGARGELDAVLVQAEIPGAAIEEALLSADASGIRAILNLAPYTPLCAEALAVSDPVVLNETEASALTGRHVTHKASAMAAVKQVAAVAKSAVITIGAEGACWASGEQSGYAEAPAVEGVVDTTGAGDAFMGALAAALSRGESLATAVEFAVVAGSFSVTRDGAQASYPRFADLMDAPA